MSSPCEPHPQPQPPVGAAGAAHLSGRAWVCEPVRSAAVAAGRGVCRAGLVYNGSFEMGFNAVAVGHVGNSWGFFTNGGGANYGFYDDQWTPVVADGKHSQLIEINTKGVYPADNDRYAGIYQYVTGLHPGVTYEFRMKGLLRGAGNEDDPYRFAAQVGYLPGYQSDWGKVGNWTEMNLGPIGKRTEPGAMSEYTMKFTRQLQRPDAVHPRLEEVGHHQRGDGLQHRQREPAGLPALRHGRPGDPAWLYILSQPVDPGYSVDPGYWVEPVHPVDPGYGRSTQVTGYDGGQATCSYTVQPGDTLAWVAQSMGVSQYDLIAANGIANPDLIYVGQVLTNPSCGSAGYGLGAAPAEPYADGYAAAGDAAGGYDAGCAGYDAQVVDYPMAGAAPAGEMGAGYAAAAGDGRR